MVENSDRIFVIDSSFVLAFLLDEGNKDVESVFERQAKHEVKFVAPSLLKYEVGNSLRSKVLRKKVEKSRAFLLFENFHELDIVEEDVDYFEVLKLAVLNNLSFYDASYLYLVKQLKIKLLTLDQTLQKI
ncbi:type II toxin-antitoxin system VapC family toxin [Candidatus Roizmanbacteria bacterium]|nr:type II toxin-antitoxin system VapC family toxin [Candidatus Roizmanbacteria bacterium]